MPESATRLLERIRLGERSRLEFRGTVPELVSEAGQFTRVTLGLGVA